MKLNDLAPADWVSLTRIPLALLFLLMFRAEPGTLLAASAAVALLAQLSDHLDGYLARRPGPAPVHGWLFDSIPDRAFHIAALLAFTREYGLAEALVWLFVLRELTVYAVWIAIGDFEDHRPGFRLLGLIHAGLVRLGILVGCAAPYWLAPDSARQASLAVVSVLTGAATLFGFYCLVLVVRREPASPVR